MAEFNAASGTLDDFTNYRYRWTDEDTLRLIEWRARNDAIFTGKRNAAQKGFEMFVSEHGMEGKVPPSWVKKKWENLKQKYKDLKAAQSGLITEDGSTPAASWKWYRAMEEAMQHGPTITLRAFIATAIPDAVPIIPSVKQAREDTEVPPSKRRREPDLVTVLRHLHDRDQERERMACAREDQREREALEREEQKEREWRDVENRRMEQEERKEREHWDREGRREREFREWADQREREFREWAEQREREFTEREDRREREHQEKEDRRERQFREWAEQRDRQYREREEKFMTILQALLAK